MIPLVPAKAGIQAGFGLRANGDANRNVAWVPAFAGMSG